MKFLLILSLLFVCRSSIEGVHVSEYDYSSDCTKFINVDYSYFYRIDKCEKRMSTYVKYEYNDKNNSVIESRCYDSYCEEECKTTEYEANVCLNVSSTSSKEFDHGPFTKKSDSYFVFIFGSDPSCNTRAMEYPVVEVRKLCRTDSNGSRSITYCNNEGVLMKQTFDFWDDTCKTVLKEEEAKTGCQVIQSSPIENPTIYGIVTCQSII